MKGRALLLTVALVCCCFRAQASPLRGCLGTIELPPRLPNGRVDLDRLLSELGELRANCYGYLIARHTNDWDDLKTFLPRARKRRINVWVELLPPSESPPHGNDYSEPFRLDFDRWAEALAKLSLTETNLVAWNIDDFFHNENFFTPEMVKRYTEMAHKINPRLLSVPCWYYRQVTPATVAKYQGLFDGVLFPYRAESQPTMNFTNASLVEFEVQNIRRTVGSNIPVILDVYASRHSTIGTSTPEYVREVVKRGLHCCDGVMIYQHQDPVKNAAKYQVIKTEFRNWIKEQSKKTKR